MQFETFGSKDAPAVLFFHAMGVTGASSEPVAKYLQEKYFCILPTSTVYCAGQKYISKADEIRQVEDFLRAQGVTRLALSWPRPSARILRRCFCRRRNYPSTTPFSTADSSRRSGAARAA